MKYLAFPLKREVLTRSQENGHMVDTNVERNAERNTGPPRMGGSAPRRFPVFG
jgi:hypothetical protein